MLGRGGRALRPQFPQCFRTKNVFWLTATFEIKLPYHGSILKASGTLQQCPRELPGMCSCATSTAQNLPISRIVLKSERNVAAVPPGVAGMCSCATSPAQNLPVSRIVLKSERNVAAVPRELPGMCSCAISTARHSRVLLKSERNVAAVPPGSWCANPRARTPGRIAAVVSSQRTRWR